MNADAEVSLLRRYKGKMIYADATPYLRYFIADYATLTISRRRHIDAAAAGHYAISLFTI